MRKKPIPRVGWGGGRNRTSQIRASRGMLQGVQITKPHNIFAPNATRRNARKAIGVGRTKTELE